MGNVLRDAPNFEADGRRERGKPKNTWKRKVEEEMKKIGLTEEDATCRIKSRKDVHIMMRINGVNPATSLNGDNTGF